jgi:hypothetical protein
MSVAFTSAVLVLALVAFPRPPQKDKKDSGAKDSHSVELHILVTGGPKDAPVTNASVYVRFPVESGFIRKKEKLAEMTLKTNQEGSVKVPPVPTGKVLIQVVAQGWKTYGQWYTLKKEEETIKIKLERPPKWY